MSWQRARFDPIEYTYPDDSFILEYLDIRAAHWLSVFSYMDRNARRP